MSSCAPQRTSNAWAKAGNDVTRPSTSRPLKSCAHGSEKGQPDDPLFPSRRHDRLSPDAVQRLVAKHVARATPACLTLTRKQISTHGLRHSVAMDLLLHGLDSAVVALFLGHEKLESVKAYIHADPTLKQRALERRSPLNLDAKPGRYKPSDDLLAFLDRL
jgi:integrase/recombinase XerD